MNIAQIRKYDVANGPGVRTTVFVSGCTHNCKNCFNQEYQDFSFGKEFSNEVEDEIIEMVKETGALSILGGEPFQQGWDMVDFLKRVRMETNASIWVWSGFTFEQILNSKENYSYKYFMLNYIDFLVDGPFVEEKKDLTLVFRGSSNQRIIDVKMSLSNEKVILAKEFYEK